MLSLGVLINEHGYASLGRMERCMCARVVRYFTSLCIALRVNYCTYLFPLTSMLYMFLPTKSAGRSSMEKSWDRSSNVRPVWAVLRANVNSN